ncbi:MAG: hypothetical protein RIC95_04500 [Vicingaceae bacterium]
MKGLLLTICLSLSIVSFSNPIEELRQEYMKALHDCDEAPEVYAKFLEVENPSAKILAYRGALEAIMTRTTWNLFKKMSYLRKSEKSFEEAVRKDPNSVEIRFMRMAVQYEIPAYLGFSDDLDSDKVFVIKNIKDFKAENLPKETCKEIYAFMKRCNYFTESQIQRFKGHLALN